MSTFKLTSELQYNQRVRERLLEGLPEADEETIRDTLEGITDLHEMIAAVIRSALVDEALQAGLRTRVEDMRQRLSRLAERGLKKRQLALEAMNEAGLKKLEQPDFTASARLGAPPLVVTSEEVIPEGYWTPQP
ncbi:MAG: siphovirus Gp157 family protein, partial [Terriglobales bacterium]